MARPHTILIASILGASLVIASAILSHAGPLDPPAGPIAASYKTLNSVEPRIEINSTNTPGDSDSVYRISAPGSYYLSANLTGASGKSGIEIASNDVTIDLNGFTLYGGSGTISGIRSSITIKGVHLRNGTITGWTFNGIDLNSAQDCEISSVTARSNSIGISCGGSSIIDSCIAHSNTGDGIVFSGVNGIIRSCVAVQNSGAGIRHAGAGNIIDCLSTTCGSDGISAIGAITISHCQSWSNAGSGFNVANATVVACNAQSNSVDGFHSGGNTSFTECQALANFSDGFELQYTSSMFRCSCQGNNVGIHLTVADNRIEENNIVQNTKGIRAESSGNIFVRNHASGNSTVNYDLVPGNIGIFVNATSAGTVFGSAGGTAPGSTDPSANFSY